MNNSWSKKWSKALLWTASYVHFIGFILVGGYFIFKNHDEELKKEAKTAFIVSLIFLGIEAFLIVLTYLLQFAGWEVTNSSFSTNFALNSVVAIAKIAIFAIFVIRSLLEKDKEEINE